MGIFANLGISLRVQDTLPKNRGELDPLTDSASTWTHTSAANGGYLTASCNINEKVDFIDEWLENGLGRWLTLYDEAGLICWRGFVDQINANIGGVQVQRGPLTGIANRVHMVYSTIDASTTPPTTGVRATTAQTNDTASQALFGIWQKILSCGGTTAADAAQLQALYLAENAQPQMAKTVTLGGTNLGMSLNLKGTWEWLKAFVANFTTAGTVHISDRLIAILALDPNGIFSADHSYITANTYHVKGYANDDKVAQNYIKELVTFGDAAFNRYTAGFYGEEIFYYTPAPTYTEYTYSISDPAQEVEMPGGITVRPWNVQPTKWYNISDFMIGRVPDADMRDDPRQIFIETVQFTAPYGLQVNGQKVNTLAQVMAQKGLSGLGG